MYRDPILGGIIVIKTLLGCVSLDANKRYTSKHKLFEYITRKLGYRLYNHSLYWHEDADFLSMWSKFVDGIGRKTIQERRFTLYSFAKSVANIKGDTVECGVFRGGSSHIIMSASQSFHHIFDSFEGLSAPTNIDKPLLKHGYEWQESDLSVAEEIVSNNLHGFKDQFKMYKGWIPDRFEDVSENTFKLVHIDVDLYDPTKDALKFFSQRMVPGGMIVCDDYGSTICPGAKIAFDEIAQELNKRTISLTTGQGLLLF